MDVRYCQSCGMPMGDSDEMYGTNEDGNKNTDYCKYCYDNGKFTADCTMEEMINFCVPHMVSNNSGMDENKARSMMQTFFPTLKRWQ